ncbi:hypothetical protein [Pseudomonas aeruginosa]|uniref:hypothetical protein n=1 Tax=Pseudomonas aeruginosa TaxID=287 RepID=UPI000EB60BD0|nr:hypothetical protein [Pseudomonas aeruginosa]
MHDIQVARLRSKYPAEFTTEQAAMAVARAYGFRHLDLNTLELSDPVAGLQYVRPYGEMLKQDPVHQLMDFMRMSLNLSLSQNEDVRRGVPERHIVAAMSGFSNFDALLSYARSDPVDPNTTDREMLAKFQGRYGYYAPIQYVLGRYIHDHCLIIQPDAHKAQRFVDQEVVLNPLGKTKVVIFRDDPRGADWLSVMARNVPTLRGELDSSYETRALKAMGDANVLVSLAEPKHYSLQELVAAHSALLTKDSPDGRALIVDVQNLRLLPNELDTAFATATESGIHVVVIVREPNAELWKRTGIHLIFGFDKDIQESYLEMDKYIGYASPYVGFKRGKMQYLYHSESSGGRFGAMDLIPDDEKTTSLMDRLKDAIRG